MQFTLVIDKSEDGDVSIVKNRRSKTLRKDDHLTAPFQMHFIHEFKHKDEREFAWFD